MSRRKARILAFQALYSWDVNKAPLEELNSFSWLEKTTGEEAIVTTEEEKGFASIVVSGTIDHIDEIDTCIKEHLSSNWSFDRLNKVTLAILRFSIYEMKYQKDVIPGVVIDEAVNIAKEFGPDDSFKFINAVLDKIGKNESSDKA